jgi:rod shape-determining protein MreC
MQKKIFISYLLIFLLLLGTMSLSRQSSEKLRGESAAFLAPVWEKILSVKYFFIHPFQPSPFTFISIEEKKEQMQMETVLFETEMAFLQKQMDEQLLLASQIRQAAPFNPKEALSLSEECNNSLQRNFKTIKRRLKGLPARVVFRSYDTWNHSLWINLGESANQNLPNRAVAINSPVVVGKAIVGIIDYVGKHQSRVRLISDNRLNPSVRAARGGEQESLISEQVEILLQQITRSKELPLSHNDQTELLKLLKQLKGGLDPLKKTWVLAKGELLGSKSGGKTLKGTGFNYDFADEEGDSRDLRTGKALHHPKESAIPILKINDILLTTGLDGVLPPDFQIAIITHVGLLKEGDYFYEIEARPIVGQLQELALVFVLPPQNEESIIEPRD